MGARRVPGFGCACAVVTPDDLHHRAMALCDVADCFDCPEVKRYALRRAWRLDAKAARIQLRRWPVCGAWWATVLNESAAWCAVQAGSVRTAWAIVEAGRRMVAMFPESPWQQGRLARLDLLASAIEDLEWAPMEAKQ